MNEEHKFSLDEICNKFSIPPHLVGGLNAPDTSTIPDSLHICPGCRDLTQGEFAFCDICRKADELRRRADELRMIAEAKLHAQLANVTFVSLPATQIPVDERDVYLSRSQQAGRLLLFVAIVGAVFCCLPAIVWVGLWFSRLNW